MQIQNRIKYQVVCCIEREMHIVGIYPSMEEAKKAMLLDMDHALECSTEDIPDCEELSIGETSAWANNVGLSNANYDWNIFALTCDGECREYVPGDEDVINATYCSYWDSGAASKPRAKSTSRPIKSLTLVLLGMRQMMTVALKKMSSSATTTPTMNTKSFL